MSSAEKKRLRDRRAQQTMRDKKLHRMSQLEAQVAHCQEYHCDQGVQRLLEIIKALRKQNDALLRRQEHLKHFVESWDTDPLKDNPSGQEVNGSQSLMDSDPSHPPTSKQLQPQLLDSQTISDSSHTTTANPPSFNPEHPHPSNPESLPSSPNPWALLPLNDDFTSTLGPSVQWFAHPEKIATCPPSPSSPLDLLHGTRSNYLADSIHQAMRRRPFRDPERLAMGWLAYHLTKWLLFPSAEAYAKLPVFLRPVTGQMQLVHPISLDYPPWPKLRLNLIKRWHLYRESRDEFFGMFACCAKVRWPWGESILERDEENELQIRWSFFETFMGLDGWGLTPEFIGRFPDLLEGMDIREVMYEVV